MVAMNGNGIIQAVWGPYSPKTHDSDFIQFHQTELSDTFAGLTLVGDAHFSWGRTAGSIPDVRVLAPYSDAGRKQKRVSLEGQQQESHLSAAQQHYNQLVCEVRARVESPFGLAKVRFNGLLYPFGEDDDQLKCLFVFAAAIENCSRLK